MTDKKSHEVSRLSNRLRDNAKELERSDNVAKFLLKLGDRIEAIIGIEFRIVIHNTSQTGNAIIRIHQDHSTTFVRHTNDSVVIALKKFKGVYMVLTKNTFRRCIWEKLLEVETRSAFNLEKSSLELSESKESWQ